jgi:transposase
VALARRVRAADQLHLAVDAATNAIIAATLTTGSEGDTSQVGPLLDQTPGSIGTIMVDVAYDGEPIYQTAAARDPAATVVIPPRSTALPRSTNLRTARPAYPVPCQKGPPGLATENLAKHI